MFGEVEVHLGRGLGAGRHLEDDAHPVDDLLLAGTGDGPIGRDEGDRAGGSGLPQPHADLAARPGRDARAGVEQAPAGHGRSHVDVLGDRVLHEVLGGQDGHVALGDPADPAEVVDVGVRVDHPADRTVAASGPVELQTGAGRLRRDERIDDQHALVPLDQGHVGQVEAAHLVDALGDLVQPLLGAQSGLAPQTGVGGVGALLLQEGVGAGVPHDPPPVVLDDTRFQTGDETAIGVGEVVGDGVRGLGADGVVGVRVLVSVTGHHFSSSGRGRTAVAGPGARP